MKRLLLLVIGVFAVLCRPSAFLAPHQLRLFCRHSAAGHGTEPLQSGSPDMTWFGLGAVLLLVPTFGARHVRSRRVARAAGPVLFGSPGSRSPLVNWYLHEIGQDFEMVDAARVDRYSMQYPSPFGKIPALADGDLQVFESGAILMFLADKYGGLDTPEKRAEVNKWIVWANATLDPICFKEDGNGRVLDTGLRGEPQALQVLDNLLDKSEFLLGSGEESFSVADVAVGSYLLYVPLFFPDVSVAKWHHIQRYMLQLLERPAYQRAFGAGTAEKLMTIVSKKGDSKMFGLF
ncbi:Glutathione S-transferase GstB [Durusdinium trenchii]|uniref:Glutathione S-transferase GstB n=1 Tax=Durusdinium trenchii TaxID=1381693 RepID=A0ABP0SSS1_9DINO